MKLRHMESENAIAYADPKITQLILRNLVSNAIKFTPREGEIQINVKANGKQLAIEVCDNEIGIAKVDQTKLFNPDLSLEFCHEGLKPKKSGT